MGVRTGLDLQALPAVSQHCQDVLGRALHSRVAQSGFNPLIAAAEAA